jgi:RIO kinase 2
MELVSGDQLNRVTLSNPGDLLEMILDEVGAAWRQGIVHADLSEFNIIVSSEGARIIDWPQAVERTHQNARILLERDLSNLLSFFARKYRIQMPLEEALERLAAKGEPAREEAAGK